MGTIDKLKSHQRILSSEQVGVDFVQLVPAQIIIPIASGTGKIEKESGLLQEKWFLFKRKRRTWRCLTWNAIPTMWISVARAAPEQSGTKGIAIEPYLRFAVGRIQKRVNKLQVIQQLDERESKNSDGPALGSPGAGPFLQTERSRHHGTEEQEGAPALGAV